jgi:hypothetical protein
MAMATAAARKAQHVTSNQLQEQQQLVRGQQQLVITKLVCRWSAVAGPQLLLYWGYQTVSCDDVAAPTAAAAKQLALL